MLFFFSGLGAFNGLLLSFYFMFLAKPRSQSNIFLGVLLFMLSVRVAKSVFYFFMADISYTFLQVGLTACFLIGPFLYFYFASVSTQRPQSSLHWKQHLYVHIPIILLINILYPFESNIELWDPYIIKGIYVVWTVYAICALYQIRDVIAKLFNKSKKIDKFEFWLLSIWGGLVPVLAAYFFCGIASYILGAMLFSFFFYILFVLLAFRFNKEPFSIAKNQKYGRKKVKNAESLIASLTNLMEVEKVYQNPLLNLHGLAARLNILPHTLSQLLNENLDIGFSQYLNQYRIKEACAIIKEKKNQKFEAIGYDVGYNSKSTFYAAFKKITGTTPAKFNSNHTVA